MERIFEYMTHLFVITINHPRNKPGHNVWRCDKCDSEAVFMKKYTQADVNRIIGEKLPCVPPVGGSNDNIIIK